MMKATEPKKHWMKAKCDTSVKTCKIFRLFSKNSVENLSRVIFSLDLDPDKHYCGLERPGLASEISLVLHRKGGKTPN